MSTAGKRSLPDLGRVYLDISFSDRFDQCHYSRMHRPNALADLFAVIGAAKGFTAISHTFEVSARILNRADLARHL